MLTLSGQVLRSVLQVTGGKENVAKAVVATSHEGCIIEFGFFSNIFHGIYWKVCKAVADV